MLILSLSFEDPVTVGKHYISILARVKVTEVGHKVLQGS